MPFYDYVCISCGHKLEVRHSVHGHGPSACPRCGSPMKQAFSPPTVHYKGTGWARKERAPGKSNTATPQEAGSVATEASSGASVAAPAETVRKDED